MCRTPKSHGSTAGGVEVLRDMSSVNGSAGLATTSESDRMDWADRMGWDRGQID
ncbi:hypothetical protein ACFQ61_29515 [Streptomyces sp. NPDC056500]|uniref:hypothetical protein n=1 Tax=Streptomyces sp. NPDC056500 TaxID=3345840 RepID=UPI00368DA9E5